MWLFRRVSRLWADGKRLLTAIFVTLQWGFGSHHSLVPVQQLELCSSETMRLDAHPYMNYIY